MKKIFFIIGLFVSFVASSQTWIPVNQRQRFTIGLGLPVKTFTPVLGQDSAQIWINPSDSTIKFTYKGGIQTLLSGSFKASADSFFVTGFSTRGRLKQLTDSMSGTLLKYTDTSSLLGNYARYGWVVKYTDTSSMLSNRLKISDTANAFSNYLRKTTLILPAEGGTGYTSLSSLAGDAAFTGKYLALTGGTLTGGLTGTTGNFSSSVTSTSFIGGSFSGTTGNFSSTLSSSVDATIHGLTVGTGGYIGSNTNMAVGSSAMPDNTSSRSYNTAIGYFSLNAITSGLYNTSVGAASSNNLTTSSRGTFIGYGTATNIQAQANDNTFIGYVAGGQATGSSNTIIGSNAGNVGSGTLYYQTTLIGDSTRLTGNFNNSTALGYQAVITASNQMVFGNSSVTANVFNGSVTGGAASFTTGAFSSTLSVNNARAYFTANNENYAIGVSRTGANNYYFGVTNSGSPDLLTSNNSGTIRSILTDGGSFTLGSTSGTGIGALYAGAISSNVSSGNNINIDKSGGGAINFTRSGVQHFLLEDDTNGIGFYYGTTPTLGTTIGQNINTSGSVTGGSASFTNGAFSSNLNSNQTSNNAWIYQALNGSGVTLGGFYRGASGDGQLYVYSHTGTANVFFDGSTGTGVFSSSVTASSFSASANITGGTGLSGALTGTLNNISIGSTQYTPLVGSNDDRYMKVTLYDGGSNGTRGGFSYGYDAQGNFGGLTLLAQRSFSFQSGSNGSVFIVNGNYNTVFTTLPIWSDISTSGIPFASINDAYNASASPGGQIFNSAIHEYALGYGSTPNVNGTAVLKWNTSGNVTVTGTFGMKGYTVGTLPAGVTGAWAYVTDASGPTYGATVVGGGSVVTPVFYNGSNWTCR